jgi:hypothetical protein
MTTEERFEKIEAGIRDLIVVSRTVLTSVEQMNGTIGELREAQKRTDDTLNALVQAQTESEQKVSRLADSVEKLIRFRGPNGQT